MMIGLLKITVPVAIWWRAEGSKKTRLSDLTVKNLQLHHSVPKCTIHFSWTVTYKKGPPYRKSDCKRSKHKSCKSWADGTVRNGACEPYHLPPDDSIHLLTASEGAINKEHSASWVPLVWKHLEER